MARKKSVVAPADAAASVVEPAMSAMAKVNRSASVATMDWEFAAPDVPRCVAELDNRLMQRAIETWRAAHSIKAVVERWQQWFTDLRAHGDADPVIARRCRDILQQSLDCLCGNIETCRREYLRELARRLPRTPSYRLNGTHDEWNAEANAWVEVEHPCWQKEPELWNSYRDYESNLHFLYGAAGELLQMLKRFPASVLDREWQDGGTPNEQLPTGVAAADNSGKPDANKSNDAGEQVGKPEGMPTGELRNPMERVIFSMGENELTTATKKKGCRFIAFAMKPKQKDNSQLRKVLRQLRLPPYELLSPPSGHGYFLNSKGVAVYEQLKKDRLEMSLKKKKSH